MSPVEIARLNSLIGSELPTVPELEPSLTRRPFSPSEISERTCAPSIFSKAWSSEGLDTPPLPPKSATAKSGLPSPLKSPTAATLIGTCPTVSLPAGWKVPSPFPTSTDRLLEGSFVTAKSGLPSPLKWATISTPRPRWGRIVHRRPEGAIAPVQQHTDGPAVVVCYDHVRACHRH